MPTGMEGEGGGGQMEPPIGFSDLKFEAFETFSTSSLIMSASFDVN